MIPIRQTLVLSGGTVTLKAWSAVTCDGYLIDILGLCMTLATMREDWQEFRRGDVEKPVWASFWRLVHASLERGSTLPETLNWPDRWTLLEAMMALNDIEEAEKKIYAVTSRASRMLARLTPPPTTAWTNT